MKPGDSVTTLAGDRLTVLAIDGDAIRIGKPGSEGGLWCSHAYLGLVKNAQLDLFGDGERARRTCSEICNRV